MGRGRSPTGAQYGLVMTSQRRIHAFADDALGDLDATGLADAIRDGTVSPREATDAAIARARRMQPLLNALAHEGFDDARDRADRPLPGYFGGVPSVVKDNVDVAGQPTQQGSAAFTAVAARRDGEFATQLRATGLLPLGKSRLPEFGFNASTEYAAAPPVRNPWDPDYSPGASSGGSAALVASGVVPIAHANDGGGSIRIPAAACGLVGLKPTRDRLATDRLMRQMPVRIIANGVVTRSVRDTAVFLREAEKHHRNLRLPPVGDVRGPARRRLRVGLIMDSLNGVSTDLETREAVLSVAKLLEASGHTVTEVATPADEQFAEDFSTYWAMLSWFLVTNGRRTLARDFDSAAVDNLTAGLKQQFQRRAHRLPGVVRRLRRSRLKTAELFRTVDVVLTPTLSHTTPLLGHLSPEQDFEGHFAKLLEYVAFTPLQNATGDPAISLPLGQTSNGLPLGVHFTAAWGSERTLLGLAYELEAAQPFARIQDDVT